MGPRMPSTPLPTADMPLRLAMRRVVVAWIFGSAWMYLCSGAPLTQYARLLHLPPFGFGLLAAIPFLAAAVQLPTSYLLERRGGRKRLFLFAATAHRLLWLAAAALPWICPESRWWAGLLGIVLLSSLFGHMSTPAWMAWMADLVPPRLRGRYFSRRVQWGQGVGLVLTIVVGLALDAAQRQGPRFLTMAISGMLLVGAISGTVDILLFLRIPDPGAKSHVPIPGWRELLLRPLANPGFRRYLGYSATLTFGVGFVGQFVWLYVFDVALMSNTRANLLLVAVPLAVAMLVQPLWGRAIDRFGSRVVLLLAGLLVVNGASAWIFVRPESWRPGYFLVLISAAAWPGVELGSFNLLLRMSESRGGNNPGTATIAINSLVIAIAGCLSGLFGGAMAEWLGSDWQGSLFGWPLSFHGVLFLISAAVRLAALGWLIGLVEDSGVATRVAIRYFAAGVYSNLQQVMFAPIRRLGRLGWLTYRFNRRR